MQAGVPFVGREAETAALLAGLQSASEGRGQVFLIAGEPGIGKTRLADEFVELARAKGTRVASGRCWEAGGAPAYWPWVQVLRALVEEVDPATLRAQIGRGAADLAQILPDLKELLPDLAAPDPLDPETARFRLFDAVTRFLKAAGASRPLLLVLDDLQAADVPSLLLLQFVAGEVADARIVIVGIYRETDVGHDHPMARTLAELARYPLTRAIHLGGLAQPDAARLIELTTGRDPPSSLVASLHAETEGNPFFLRELARLLAAEGHLAAPDAIKKVTIPHSVRAVIARHLGRLSARCREVLVLASVLGREFDLAGLAAVSGMPVEDLLDVLAEAGGARLVSEVPGALGHLRFSHALVRDTLYEDLSPARRIRLHRQAGQALEVRYAAGVEPHLAELAHHFVQAAPGGDVGRAVDYAGRAGAQAVRSLAYEEAVRLFDMALQALDMQDTPDPLQRCELLLALGDAQDRAGNYAAAKRTFRLAAELAQTLGKPEHLGRAALGYGGRFVWEPGRGDPLVRHLLEQALDAIGHTDSPLCVRVLARLAAGPLHDSPDRALRETLSGEAVQIARRLGDPATLAYALAGRWSAVWFPENLAERLSVAEELITLAEAEGDKERASEGHLWRAMGRAEQGDMVGVLEDLDALDRLTEDLQQPVRHWSRIVPRITLATFQGRFTEAEQLSGQILALGERAAGTISTIYGMVQAWALRLLQGRLAEVEQSLKKEARQFPMYPALGCMVAHTAAELGRTSEAREEFEALAAGDFAMLPRTDEWLFSLSLLTDVADVLHDTARAAALYEQLRPYPTRFGLAAPSAVIGSVSRPLGVAAAMLGRWEDARRHFRDALEHNGRAGARPWVARTQVDFARMLLSRARPGDREEAGALLAEALGAGEELGMQALAGRARGLMDTAGVDREVTARREATAPARPGVFRREGEYWSITFEGDAFRLRDSKGLRYLARLLADPGREFSPLDLVAAEEQPQRDLPSPRLAPEEAAALPVRAGAGDLGPVLDAEAKAAYRRRLRELEEELQEAEVWHDPERASAARRERDMIRDELAGALGLGGRDRRPGSAAERARINVTKAIKGALERVRVHTPGLWQHLSATVHTGTLCAYRPDPRSPTDWQT